MADFSLEFEKPLSELKKKITELESFSKERQIDVSSELDALTSRLEEMAKDIYTHLTSWQRVQMSRHPERPYTMDYIDALFTDFTPLAGDRHFGDDHAIVGGFAMFHGNPVMAIGTQKGRDMKENVYRNFGWPSPEGYRKAMRLMRLADKAGVPVVTFIDTPGAFPGVASEERHIAEAIAVNLRDMFSLNVPVVSIVIGEGGSGGAIGLGVGNRILVMENAYYSVITPEGCAAILWKDRKFASQAADALQLTAEKLYELGIADQIIEEPFGGAHRDFKLAAEFVGKALAAELTALRKFSPQKLREQRYEKFRKIGHFMEETATETAEVPESVN